MKFIRWMLSNLILITIILALVYVYVYWDDLTGEDTPAGKIIASLSDEFTEVRDFVAIIKAKGSVEDPASSAAESVVSSDESEVVAEQAGNDGQAAAVVAQLNDRASSAPASAQGADNYYNAPAPAPVQRGGNYYNAPAPAPVQRGGNYYNAPAPAPVQRAENYYKAPAPAQRADSYYNAPAQAPSSAPLPAPAASQRADSYYSAPAPVQRAENYYNAPAAAPAQPSTDISEAVEPSSNEEQPAASQAATAAAESEDRFVSPEIEQALNRVSVDGKISGGTAEAEKSSTALAQAPPSDLGSITPEPVAVAAPEQVAVAGQATAAPAQASAPGQAAVPAQAAVPDQAPVPGSQPGASQTAGSAAGVTGIDVATRALWLDARRAFRKRDYETCEQNYQKLIAANKDNMDAYGELGNVYFNQGKREQAAAAYYEAAAIMIKQGQVRRAASLTGLLRHLDQTRAEQLKTLIDNSMQSPS